MKIRIHLSFGALILLLGARVGVAQTISGTVFEDANYGGGSGRSMNTAGGTGVSGATVELYTSAGAYVKNTTTGTGGTYSFTGLTTNASYIVRVVGSTVASQRTGGTATGLVPVQTFRTKGGNGTADTERVGGESPGLADSGPYPAGNVTATFNFVSLNTADDKAVFVDNLTLASSGAFTNPSFETPSQGTGSGAYTYRPSGATWTFSGNAGITYASATNNSAWNAPAAPDGSQVAFLQGRSDTGTGSIQQAISLAQNTSFTLTLKAAQRNTNSGGQSVKGTVTIGGVATTLTFSSSDGGAVSSGNIAPGNTSTFYTYTATFSTPGGISSIVAQSQAPVTLATGGSQTGVDFGYNFDTVVNTNDAGQGSLRQFILNSNALTSSLSQVGLTAGRETSIFMIPDGSAHAGLTAYNASTNPGLASQLTGSSGAARAVINVTSAVLPAITDANTWISGLTQTTNINDSNTGQLGTGGTVGVQAVALSQFSRPEVEVSVLNSLSGVYGLDLEAAGLGVTGIALHGGTILAGSSTAATSLQITGNLIGITALSVADPGGTAYTSSHGIYIRGASYGRVMGNLIGYNGNSGLNYSGGSGTAGLKVDRNEFVQNGYRTTGGDAITAGDQAKNGPMIIAFNLITTSNSDGLQFEIGQTGTITTTTTGGVTTTTNTGNSVRNNTFFDNGNGSSSSVRNQLEGAGILYLQRGSNSGTASDSIYYNIVNQSQASGIVVGYGQKGIIITRNSTYGNGTTRNSSTGGNLGIDIITQSNYYVGSTTGSGGTDYGNGDGVTPNTGTTTTAFAQGGINYPVFTLTRYNTSTSITVAGYVGSAAGQTAFGGATVDIYFSNNLDGNNNGAIVAGDGLSVPHGEGQTYITTLTADANGNFSATIAAPTGITFSTTGQSLTGTAYLSGFGTSEFGPNSVLAAVVVSGIVFEDANYGGGAGRSRTTLGSGAVARGGATVEIYNYNSSGPSYSIVGSTTTDASTGAYSFNVPAGSYVVRTVVPTVTSARTSNATGKTPLAVQTYVRNDVNRVGGETTAATADAAAASTVGTLLSFVGYNPSGLDNTAFVDNVVVLDANGNALATNPVANQGFETPVVSRQQYEPANASWTFKSGGGNGIARNGGDFNPNTSADSQVGFIQGDGSYFQQTVQLPAGVYSIRFVTAQRTDTRVNNQTVVVKLNGVEIGRITPSSSTYVTFTTNTFSVAGASQSSVPGVSQVPVTVQTTSITDVDFGYNFDTVVNTNDAGMGSLRQFVLNSNELGGESSLAQVYTGSSATTALTAGKESSIFMVPGPNSVPGLRSGLASQLSSGVAVITPTGGGYAITDANTIIDGTTQTRNADTNTASLGAGSSVGAAGTTTVGKVSGPEVQLSGTPGQTGSDYGLTFSGLNDGVQGIAILGFGNSGASGTGNSNGANIYITGGATSGNFVTNNVIGTVATAFPTTNTDPNSTTTRSTGSGILLGGFASGSTVAASITGNLIGYNGVSGVQNMASAVANPSDLTTLSATNALYISGNEIRANAQLLATGDGVRLGGAKGVVLSNLITNNRGSGVDFDGSTGGVLVQNNTVSNSGAGGTETSGIRTWGTGNTVKLNSIVNNTDSGVLGRAGSGSTATATIISQNSIGNNGKLGIKLLSTTDAETVGTVLLNDSGDTDGGKANSSAIGGNSMLNFPVISQATISGSNLLLAGYARPNSVIELFYAAISGTAADASGFGEGPTYLYTMTEGSSTDTDARVGSYSGSINGRVQGSDYTNRFTFSIPLSALPSGFAANAVLTATATSASGYTSEYSGLVTVTTGPLPVQLVTFTAQAVGNRDGLLQWTTASEVNNDHFDVERSFDGSTFSRVSRVAGQGSKATSTSYSYLDAGVAARAQGQLVYYRLNQVDLNGTSTYSPVRSVGFGNSLATLTLLPNPASASTGLDLTALPGAATYQVHLLDATGRTVREWALAGGQLQPLDLGSLSAGSYLVLVSGPQADGSALRQVLRLVKE